MTKIEPMAWIDTKSVLKMVNDAILSINDYEQTKTFSVPFHMCDDTRPMEIVVTIEQRFIK